MDAVLLEIRDWLSEFLDNFDSLPSDTIPERIKANRGFGVSTLGGDINRHGKAGCILTIKGIGNLYTKSSVLNKKVINVPFLNDIKEIKDLIYEWYHYFDTGYIAPHTIDELPGLLKSKIEQAIKKIDEQ